MDDELSRRDAQEAQAGLEYFAAERVELLLVIIVMSLMISIIDPNFRFIMYLLVFIGIVLIGYRFYISFKNPPEPPKKKEEEEILLSTKG